VGRHRAACMSGSAILSPPLTDLVDRCLVGENFLPNEMRRGIHFGLGLTPYTDFHVDLTTSLVDVWGVMSEEEVELHGSGQCAG
jgi:hypothetical protein